MYTIIYILTNESMPDYIKIGKTDKDPILRAKELFSTGVPLPFEIFYARRVEQGDGNIEKKIHEIFDDYRENPAREFFTVSPEKAKMLLEIIPGEEIAIRGDVVEDEIDKKNIDKRKKHRSNFNFASVGIPINSVLKFTRNLEREVIVKSQKNLVSLDGSDLSLSAAALKLLHESGFDWISAQGSNYFRYNGDILEDLRKKLEVEE